MTDEHLQLNNDVISAIEDAFNNSEFDASNSSTNVQYENIPTPGIFEGETNDADRPADTISKIMEEEDCLAPVPGISKDASTESPKERTVLEIAEESQQMYDKAVNEFVSKIDKSEKTEALSTLADSNDTTDHTDTDKMDCSNGKHYIYI